jgi:hypothetical protein
MNLRFRDTRKRLLPQRLLVKSARETLHKSAMQMLIG